MGPITRNAVASALFSGVQQRVLGLLFQSPEKSFYINEIEHICGTGRGALYRELKRLREAGLIVEKPIGRQRHYQANINSFIYQELRSIILKTFGLGDVLRGCLISLKDRIRCAFIYGSVAKGTDTAASDIDLMVIGDGVSYSDVFAALGDVDTKLGRKVNPTVYSVEEFRGRIARDNHFVTRVLDQATIMVLGDIDDVTGSSAEQSGQDKHAETGAAQSGGDRRTD
jgi:predicted nucleotidyltransferase